MLAEALGDRHGRVSGQVGAPSWMESALWEAARVPTVVCTRPTNRPAWHRSAPTPTPSSIRFASSAVPLRHWSTIWMVKVSHVGLKQDHRGSCRGGATFFAAGQLVEEVTPLSQLCLRRFASAPYKDSRTPQNLSRPPAWSANYAAAWATARLLYRGPLPGRPPRPAAGQAMKLHRATAAKRPATALQGTTATTTRAFRAAGRTTVRHVPLSE